ncbi:MAG: glycosyltransferase family 2 protein [Candidatus Diapherotrites archaeon]|nr:glycosyltransferase family 2 protein [Candidatus Diapherotrites archaeon]
MPEKVVVFVPVFNEEKTVGKVLSDLVKLKQARIVHEIVVVNDGSTDDSKKIIEEFPGIHVINLRRNIGKGFAFYAGAKKAQTMGATKLVMLDSDLEKVDEMQMQILLKPLEKVEIKMSVARLSFLINSTPLSGQLINHNFLSGQRAIKMSALTPLLEMRRDVWLEFIAGISKSGKGPKVIDRSGYGFEVALNHLIAGDKFLIHSRNTEICTPHFHEHSSKPNGDKFLLMEEINSTIEKIRNRTMKLNRLKDQKKRQPQKRPK